MSLGSSDIVAIAALIISLAAFVTTSLQVLQQYLASAEGFRRCAPSVMGLWSAGTHRKFRRHELRFETVFETPIIFLAPPSNTKGPIPQRPIYKIEGTDRSYADTNTMKPGDEKITNISTADDERASWVTLLSALQLEERQSRQWEDDHRLSTSGKKYDPPEYSIITMMQKKTRSYDFMPANVTKPFATTTISHLVEMVGLLGMYWKAFDELKGNVRAEGNGYMLTSTQVHGLGLMTTFSVTGFSKFKENRVIPTHDVKELVFGFIPTILGTVLEVGKDGIHRTLASFKCNSRTLDAYKDKKERYNIPSETFEIVAMLATPLRIRGSNFKMLPNPTADRWVGPSNAISWTLALCKFYAHIEHLLNDSPGSPLASGTDFSSSSTLNPIITTIQDQWYEMQKVWKSGSIDIDMREAIHTAIDEISIQLLEVASKPYIAGVVAAHLRGILMTSDTIQDEILGNSSIPGSPSKTVHSKPTTPTGRFVNVYMQNVLPIVIDHQLDAELPAEVEKQKMAVVWCGLVFRMFCWFALHDFDRADINMMPSDMKGSRMPVFIG